MKPDPIAYGAAGQQRDEARLRVLRIQPLLRSVPVVAMLVALQGCGGVALSPLAKISMAATVAGGVSHGSIMGGSTLGALHNAFDNEPAVAALEETKPPLPAVKITKETVRPQFRDGLERACYFPNASGRGLPCT